MICPSCGSTNFKVSRQCPEYNGAPVCSDCCRRCKHYDQDNYRCKWYIANDRIDSKEEAKRLERQIYDIEKRAAYFYERSLPRKAEKLEREALILRRKKKQYENL